MAELVDALDLGSSSLRSGGSSPFTRTIMRIKKLKPSFFISNKIIVCYNYLRRVLPMDTLNSKEDINIELGINDALAIWNIKDNFESFSKDLYDIVHSKNSVYNLRSIRMIDYIISGKIVFGQKNLKQFSFSKQHLPFIYWHDSKAR